MIVVFGARKRVRVAGEGRFFCLRCEAERVYQVRDWSIGWSVFVIPLGSSRGRFVFCTSCETAFEMESLDESSTAEWHEIDAYAPRFALVQLRSRPGTKTASAASPAELGTQPSIRPHAWSAHRHERRH